MSSTISKHRLAAYKRQKSRCYYCGLPVWLKQPEELVSSRRINVGALSRLRCTAEHLLARQDGGTDSGAIIVAACHSVTRQGIALHRRRMPKGIENMSSAEYEPANGTQGTFVI